MNSPSSIKKSSSKIPSKLPPKPSVSPKRSSASKIPKTESKPVVVGDSVVVRSGDSITYPVEETSSQSVKEVGGVLISDANPPLFSSPPSQILPSQIPPSPKSQLPPASPSRVSLQIPPASPKSQLPPASPSRVSLQIPPASPSRIPASPKLQEAPMKSLHRNKSLEENLTRLANSPQIPLKKDPVAEIQEKPRESPATGLTKVAQSPSTAVFGNYQGELPNQGIEKALLDRSFLPLDKILSRDPEGNIVCNFIKVRDGLGRIAFVELDTSGDGLGYISVPADSHILTITSDASVIPYSLKVGTYEASKGDVYGIGFECNNSICVMARKGGSLSPSETVFNYSKGNEKVGQSNLGILDNHPIPYPVVKLSEILKAPKQVMKNIELTHARLRETSFNSCQKEVERLQEVMAGLESETKRYEKSFHEVSDTLSSTVERLEKINSILEKKGVSDKKDEDTMKTTRFNLQKRHELIGDFISFCHSMKERTDRLEAIREEMNELNNYAQELFHGLKNVFVEK